jgi:hypothetical protein
LTVGSEDGFREEEHMAGKLKPLNVERETRPGKYPDGDGLYLIVASTSMTRRSISRATRSG